MADQQTRARIEAQASTLRELFEQPVQFIVPDYQRKYIWQEEEEWEPLWDDIQDLCEKLLVGKSRKAVTPHFMGSIVLMPRENADSISQSDVVDGQQRIMTFQLVLDAAHACMKRGTKTHRLLTKLTTNAVDNDTGDSSFDLKAQPWDEDDRGAFIHAMRDELSTDAHSDSRVAGAHAYFTRKIRQWVNEEPKNATKRVAALTTALTDLLQVVTISLTEADDAQLIFETLNARGTPLGTFELLKNFVQRAAKEQGLRSTAIYNQHLRRLDGKWWTGLTGSGRLRKSYIDSFLHHWLVMETGVTEISTAKVFTGIRHYIMSTRRGDVEAVTEELSRHADLYYRFQRGDELVEFGDFVRRWRTLRADTLVPLILWLWDPKRGGTIQQRLRAFKAIESYLVRRLVCEHSTRGYGDLCRALLDELRPDHDNSPDRIVIQYLKERRYDYNRWPSDEEFREGFVSPNKITARRRRMVLEAIECGFRNSPYRTTPVELAKLRGLTIEHVLPRQSNTPGYTAPGLEAHGGDLGLIECFGNLTLLENRLNSKLSNAPWLRKREAYLQDHKSQLALNRDLVRGGERRKLDDWTAKEIRERAARLAERAIEIWPGPTDPTFAQGR